MTRINVATCLAFAGAWAGACAHWETQTADNQSSREASTYSNDPRNKQSSPKATEPGMTFSLRSHRWFRSRGRDVTDIVEARIGFGSSIAVTPFSHLAGDWLALCLSPLPQADVEATCLARIGIGFGWRLMWGIGSDINGQTAETVAGFPFSNLGFLGMGGDDWRKVAVFHSYIIDATEEEREGKCGLVPLILTPQKNGEFGPPVGIPWYPPIRWADVGIGATTLFPAFRVGISPGETLDFLTGWFGLDLAGDDNR